MSFNMNASIGGLNSLEVAVPTAGPYVVSGKLQVPTLVSGASGPSGVVVTITNQTQDTTIYTGVAGAEGFQAATGCAAGDILEVALTSSNSVDQGLNTVKCQLGISSGVS